MLFREIRKSKVRSYLLYAIGEVLLIIIGILVATSIGEYQQEKTNKNEIAKILRNMERDLRGDSGTFSRNILARYDIKNKGLNTVKQFIDGDYIIKDSAEFVRTVSKGAVFSYWIDVNRIAFEQLQSSNLGYLIEDDSIRNFINVCYGYSEKLKESAPDYGNEYLTSMNSLRPFFFQNSDSVAKKDMKYFIKALHKNYPVYEQANLELTKSDFFSA